jgi:23S rRNA pseudouridine2605 synthase
MPARSRPKNRRPADSPRGGVSRAGGQRLQKVLAAAGIGSRRRCEELIAAGRVEVDRQVVTELGTKVDAARQEIRLDGVPLRTPKCVCYAVNKPPGVVSTSRDPSGRPRVVDLAPATGARLFCVGRLDLSSEGLILVTNDGELANRLTHPRYGVPKTYRVLVAGRPTHEVLAKLRRGVRLAEGLARVEQVRVKSRQQQSTVLEMVLREGRNREIRRALARLGHKVLRLVRIAVGPVRLGDLPPGGCRKLTGEELEALRRAVR